jgi:hypothetical protein
MQIILARLYAVLFEGGLVSTNRSKLSISAWVTDTTSTLALMPNSGFLSCQSTFFTWIRENDAVYFLDLDAHLEWIALYLGCNWADKHHA